MSLTEIAINRPSLIIVIFAVLTLGGLFAYSQLGYQLMPDFAPPTVTITTVYPGASPTEVESAVTKKLEDALAELDGVDDITSRSLENASLLIVNFKYGVDIDLAMQDAQRKIDNIKKDLPEDARPPVMLNAGPNDLPIMQMSATAKLPGPVFFKKMEDEFLPRLQKLKGVAQISLLGGQERQINVRVDQDKLAYYKLTINQVTQAVGAANIEFPTGKVKDRAEQVTVKLAGKFASLDQLRDLVVLAQPGGGTVRVRDVAQVTDGLAEASSVIRYNGLPGIGLSIKKSADGNTVDISRAVRAELAKLEQANAKDELKFVVADDSSLMTLASVEAVTHDLGIAVILVGAVMLLFLHSLRNAAIVLISIPASLVSTFIAMYALGYTLNLMTLLAMSLVIGILVDDSIVVLENIYRHLEMGKDKRTAALDGRNEIGFTALAITMVDVVVFLPITFVSTTVADILRQFSMVVAISTLMSLFVCFTLTPWLASRFSKMEKLNPANLFQRFLLWFEKTLDRYIGWYGRSLEWGLNHKLLSVLIIIGLFFGLGQVMKLGIMGQELMARGDQGKFMLRLEYDKTTSLVQNNLTSGKIERALLARPEVAGVFANIGGPSSSFGSTGLGAENKAELTLELKPEVIKQMGTYTEKHMMAVRRDLEGDFRGINMVASVIGLVQTGPPIEFTISGENRELVMATAQKLRKLVVNTAGANDVDLSVEEGNPEVDVVLDREKMSRLGLNVAQVGLGLQNAYAGNDDAEFTENGTEYPIRVVLDEFDRRNPDNVREFTLLSPVAQRPVKLGEFASTRRSLGPSLLERKNRRSSVTLTAYALGKGSGTIAQEIDKALAADPLPAGVDFAWGGDIKRQSDSFGAMGMAILASLILVYLLMVALYDNFIYPFVVLFSIPVALIGAFLALNLAGASFNIFTGLGILMLLGLVAKNAILIVDFANHLKSQGWGTYQALVEAGKERQRPILMTTVAMVIGMLPIAVAQGAGAEWKSGLAIVLMGGLTSSMMLTVYLVPIMYYAVDLLRNWLARKFGLGQAFKVFEPRPAHAPAHEALA
jgi:hydrophobic/amphiphilic exporter-1 (mainly G- bacteria), HAE1 family